VVADVGGGPGKAEAAGELVGQEAEIGGFAGGEAGAQEGVGLIRPGRGVIASGGREGKASRVGQPDGFQAVEARAADAEPGAGVGRCEPPVVESGEGFLDDRKGQAVEKLFLFIPASEAGTVAPGQSNRGAAPNPGVYRIWANGSRGSVPPPERGSLPGSLSHPHGYSGCSPAEPYPPHGWGRPIGIISGKAREMSRFEEKSTFARSNCVHFCSARYRL